MKLSNKQIQSLLRMLSLTQDVEVNCDSCLNKMAEFAENSLTGKSVPEGLESIDDHLEICGECRDEFEALKAALSGQVFE